MKKFIISKGLMEEYEKSKHTERLEYHKEYHRKNYNGRKRVDNTERNKKIFFLRQKGKTLQEIGNKFGFSREYVRIILKKIKINDSL